jgi:hypothetical protein
MAHKASGFLVQFILLRHDGLLSSATSQNQSDKYLSITKGNVRWKLPGFNDRFLVAVGHKCSRLQEKANSDLRIKFYAKWKEIIKEQAVDPDQPRGILIVA